MDILHSLKRHDWVLNAAVLIVGAASVITVWSVAPDLFPYQLAWFAAGLIFMAAISLVDIRPFMSYRWIMVGFYFFWVALLVVTLLVAPQVRGVRGWIPLGAFRFQTSEFAKVMLLMLLAYFFARRHVSIAHPGIIFASFIYMMIPAMLVFLEPDWGSALVFVGLWIGFLLLSGLRPRHLALGLVAIVVVGFLSWNFFLAPYQKERIVGFFEPEYDPLGVNYSTIQSKIAIGSAGWWGKGIHQGTQAQLGFLTEPATDFIFAAFIEEWGMAGAIVLIAVFVAFLTRIIRIGLHARDNFGRFVCLGTVLMFLIEFFLNVGSNLGLVPVVGVTFPLLSYGGSSLLSKLMLLGVIQSVSLHSTF